MQAHGKWGDEDEHTHVSAVCVTHRAVARVHRATRGTQLAWVGCSGLIEEQLPVVRRPKKQKRPAGIGDGSAEHSTEHSACACDCAWGSSSHAAHERM